MTGFTDLLKSERGLFALALLIASTVLTGLDRMTMAAWQDFNLYVFGIYVAGKTATGMTGLFKGLIPPKLDTAPADAAPASDAKAAEPEKA